jgi:hypothetical protein
MDTNGGSAAWGIGWLTETVGPSSGTFKIDTKWNYDIGSNANHIITRNAS